MPAKKAGLQQTLVKTNEKHVHTSTVGYTAVSKWTQSSITGSVNQSNKCNDEFRATLTSGLWQFAYLSGRQVPKKWRLVAHRKMAICSFITITKYRSQFKILEQSYIFSPLTTPMSCSSRWIFWGWYVIVHFKPHLMPKIKST